MLHKCTTPDADNAVFRPIFFSDAPYQLTISGIFELQLFVTVSPRKTTGAYIVLPGIVSKRCTMTISLIKLMRHRFQCSLPDSMKLVAMKTRRLCTRKFEIVHRHGYRLQTPSTTAHEAPNYSIVGWRAVLDCSTSFVVNSILHKLEFSSILLI